MSSSHETAEVPREAVTVQEDDRPLLAGAAAGDRASFTQLYERHIDSVFRYCLSRLEVRADAKDAAQEVFVVAWRRSGDIRIVDLSALPWLLVTARYVCLAASKARSRRRESPLADDDVQDDGDRLELRLSIDAAVSTLTDNDRALFRLCIEEGFSYEQAAAHLGVSHATVRTVASMHASSASRHSGTVSDKYCYPSQLEEVDIRWQVSHEVSRKRWANAHPKRAAAGETWDEQPWRPKHGDS